MVALHIGQSRRRTHQGHVVKRREQDTTINTGQVEIVLQFGVVTLSRGTPTGRGGVGKSILATSSELRDGPRQLVAINRRLDSGREFSGEIDHGGKDLVSQDLAQNGPHRREREGVARQRATNTTHIDDVGTG